MLSKAPTALGTCGESPWRAGGEAVHKTRACSAAGIARFGETRGAQRKGSNAVQERHACGAAGIACTHLDEQVSQEVAVQRPRDADDKAHKAEAEDHALCTPRPQHLGLESRKGRQPG